MRNDNHPPTGAAPAADATAPAPVVLTVGRRPPAADYDVALLDLDGVVYTGQGAVPGAVAALASARAAGLRLAFVTNNASRSPSAIAAHLARLGIPATAADVVTSAQAAARLIAQRVPAGSRVLVAGGMGLRLALREHGLHPVSTAAERPAAVVQGYAPDISYGLLAEAAVAVRDGALFVASNADATLPTPRGPQPGNGALLQVVITATGTWPVVAGKPEPPLHAEAVARTQARRPLVVGDRLDTDIEGAVRAGADSMLVLTGVCTPEDAVLAPAAQRPTYISADLDGLLEPQPVVGLGGSERASRACPDGTTPRGQVRDGPGTGGPGTGGPSCAGPGTGGPGTGAWHSGVAPQPGAVSPGVLSYGGWEARLIGSEPLELTGEGAWIDGLRALCAAAWSAGKATAGQIAPALEKLRELGMPGPG